MCELDLINFYHRVNKMLLGGDVCDDNLFQSGTGEGNLTTAGNVHPEESPFSSRIVFAPRVPSSRQWQPH